MSEWNIFICKHCNNIQVKETRTKITKSTFKCQRCNKTSKIITRSKSGMYKLNSYGPFSSPCEATVVCKKIKMHLNTGSTEIWNIDCEFENV